MKRLFLLIALAASAQVEAGIRSVEYHTNSIIVRGAGLNAKAATIGGSKVRIAARNAHRVVLVCDSAYSPPCKDWTWVGGQYWLDILQRNGKTLQYSITIPAMIGVINGGNGGS